MELAVYFPNLKALLDIEEALHSIDPDRIPAFIETILFGEDLSSKEYYGNLLGLRWMQPLLDQGCEVSRIYFGQEFCEYLIPSPQDLEQAFFFTRQLGWEFTYVTGYLTDAGLDRTVRNLEVLQRLDGQGEVVVNDWGVLDVLQKDFPDFRRVLGRLQVKQLRLGRHNRPTTAPPVNMADIHADEDIIREHQLQAYRDIDLCNPLWRQALRDDGITRADLDMTPQGIDLPEAGWPDMPLGYYFPWGYLAGGRNCMTAGVLQPERQFVPLDEPCPKPCQRFNKTACIDHYPELTLQRGNSVFVFHGEYAARYIGGHTPCSRLIFEPAIPI